MALSPRSHRPDPRPHRPLYGPLVRRAERLGDVLVSGGMLSRGSVRDALQLRHTSRAALGDILRAHGQISESDLSDATARMWDLGRIDLEKCPPDPAFLMAADPAACLAAGCLPWRKQGPRIIIAISDPNMAGKAALACGLCEDRIAFAIAEPSAIRSTIEAYFHPELEENARLASPSAMNCRSWPRVQMALTLLCMFFGFATLVALAPIAAFWLTFAAALMFNLGTTMARAAALIAGMRVRRTQPDPDNVVRLDWHRPLPVISILVPLHKEARVIPSLVANVARLDYPPELLDVKLVIEADDAVTANAIAAVDLPPCFDVIRVPENALKTKPRAMNYALNFCRGSLIGIFDAEDRPDRDQLRKVVEHLHLAPPDVACVQGRLDFYNPTHNWMTRCFTIEYAVWFSLLIRGTRALGLPIPLGGTTVYFRRRHLEEVSGWDAHNVTEDADLGIRLFRFGYRAEYLPSTTWEEANAKPISWVRQRSRWLKGYMMTWWVHARRPRALIRDLGFVSALYVHILLLGGIVSYLSIPIFWLVLLGSAGLDLQGTFGAPAWLWTTTFIMMFAGQAVMLTASCLAVSEPGKRNLLLWVPTLVLYWPLGALAGFKALAEMVYAPYYWDKTEHGAYSEPDTLSQTSPKAPMETPSRVGASTG